MTIIQSPPTLDDLVLAYRSGDPIYATVAEILSLAGAQTTDQIEALVARIDALEIAAGEAPDGVTLDQFTALAQALTLAVQGATSAADAAMASVGDEIDDHDMSSQSHPDIRAEIDAIDQAIGDGVGAHDVSSQSHPDIRAAVSAVDARITQVETQMQQAGTMTPFAVGQIVNAAIAQHNTDTGAHSNIRVNMLDLIQTDPDGIYAPIQGDQSEMPVTGSKIDFIVYAELPWSDYLDENGNQYPIGYMPVTGPYTNNVAPPSPISAHDLSVIGGMSRSMFRNEFPPGLHTKLRVAYRSMYVARDFGGADESPDCDSAGNIVIRRNGWFGVMPALVVDESHAGTLSASIEYTLWRLEGDGSSTYVSSTLNGSSWDPNTTSTATSAASPTPDLLPYGRPTSTFAIGVTTQSGGAMNNSDFGDFRVKSPKYTTTAPFNVFAALIKTTDYNANFVSGSTFLRKIVDDATDTVVNAPMPNALYLEAGTYYVTALPSGPVFAAQANGFGDLSDPLFPMITSSLVDGFQPSTSTNVNQRVSLNSSLFKGGMAIIRLIELVP